MSKAPFILLINPWVTDFAAFDLWAKPMGLLFLASLLRQGGCGVALIDCMDRFDGLTTSSPGILPGSVRPYGTGKYPRSIITKPAPYAKFPRRYSRYGITKDSFAARLLKLPKPDLVWVTSMMTYWYPGAFEAIRDIKAHLPETPVWLGGIYAQLCPEHARARSGADLVFSGSTKELPGLIKDTTGYSLTNPGQWANFRSWPDAGLDLLPRLDYAPLLSGLGCPFNCPYCASRQLQPTYHKKDPLRLSNEILRLYAKGVRDFAFYDDALLVDCELALRPALERTEREAPGVRFHTPNALHVRELTPERCNMLFRSGFTTLRLGLETTRRDRQDRWGGKVTNRGFFDAMNNLHRAGFKREQIGAYLLCGLPGQTVEEIEEAMETVHSSGAMPFLSEYSPLPGTPMWEEALTVSSYDLAAEPLYHNNTFFACRRPGFDLPELHALKRLALKARRD